MELFKKVGVPLEKINELDFEKSPAFIEENFLNIKGEKIVDLILL